MKDETPKYYRRADLSEAQREAVRVIESRLLAMAEEVAPRIVAAKSQQEKEAIIREAILARIEDMCREFDVRAAESLANAGDTTTTDILDPRRTRAAILKMWSDAFRSNGVRNSETN